MPARLLLLLTCLSCLLLAPLSVAAQDPAASASAVGVPGSPAATSAAPPPTATAPASSAPSASPSTSVAVPTVAPGSPVVRGVFFFSPTCAHCEKVIAEDLPGFFEASGGPAVVRIDESLDPGEVAFYLMNNGRFQLLAVNVAIDAGARMFTEDSERLGLAKAGVPRLDIGDGVFVGDAEIPDRLPAIIAAGLAADGLDWPAVPGLAAALAPFPEAGDVPDAEQGDDEQVSLPAETLSLSERLARDPVGNAVAVVVLVLLLLSLVAVPVLGTRGRLPVLPAWLVPVLALLGIAVSAYLGMVETNDEAAICGPVGDCNAVQQSEYALLFGVPIGVLGLIGYALLLGGWLLARLVRGRTADLITVALALGAFGGVAFSAYLTFLEPFVIGATCMWCITSALTMLALLWLLAAPAWAAADRLRGRAAAGHPA